MERVWLNDFMNYGIRLKRIFDFLKEQKYKEDTPSTHRDFVIFQTFKGILIVVVFHR